MLMAPKGTAADWIQGTGRRSAGQPVRAPPGVRPLPGPAGERPRLLAGGRERHEWLDAYGGHAVAATGHSPSARGPRHRGAGGHAALLLDRGAAPGSASSWRSGWPRSVPIRSGGCSSATRARRPTRTPCTWRARHTGRHSVVSVLGGWHGRTAATLAVHRRHPLRGRRRRRAASRSPPGAVRRRRRRWSGRWTGRSPR